MIDPFSRIADLQHEIDRLNAMIDNPSADRKRIQDLERALLIIRGQSRKGQQEPGYSGCLIPIEVTATRALAEMDDH